MNRGAYPPHRHLDDDASGDILPMRLRSDFVLGAFMNAYVSHGGLATSSEIVHPLRSFWCQPLSMVATWIVHRRVLSLPWRSQLLLPLFQFVRPRMTLLPEVSALVSKLGDCMEDESVASWLVTPNAWLRSELPIDVVLSDPEVGIEGADHDRLVLIDRRVHLGRAH